jgi:AcrR family transcriptional regulator
VVVSRRRSVHERCCTFANMSVQSRARCQPDGLLRVATDVLVVDPSASLDSIARAAGIGRTTVYRRYPTRQALLSAAARDALDVLEGAYSEAMRPEVGDDAAAVLRRLVAAMVPVGARVEFLFRVRPSGADPGVVARVGALDARVRVLVRRLQASGQVCASVPEEWLVLSLNALVFSAWLLVARGRMTPAGACDLVLDALLRASDAARW